MVEVLLACTALSSKGVRVPSSPKLARIPHYGV